MVEDPRIENAGVTAHEMMFQIGAQHASGAKDRGLTRHQNATNAEFSRDHADMDRAGATSKNEGEFALAVAFLDRNLTDRRGHIHIHDPIHASGGGAHIQAEGLGDMFRDSMAGRSDIEPNTTASEELGIKIAEEQ